MCHRQRRLDGFFRLIRLDGNEHQIEGCESVGGRHDRHRNGDGLDHPDLSDFQSRAPQQLGACRIDFEQRDILAGAREEGADQTSQCTRPDDQDPHAILLR